MLIMIGSALVKVRVEGEKFLALDWSSYMAGHDLLIDAPQLVFGQDH